MVVPASGGALRDLLPGCDAHVRALAWMDSETLQFVADEGVGSTLGEVRRYAWCGTPETDTATGARHHGSITTFA